LRFRRLEALAEICVSVVSGEWYMKAAPSLSQDQLDDLAAEIAALLNDGGSHTKEFWKAYIKRHRKRTRAAPTDKTG
jgi:hypothetical protein